MTALTLDIRDFPADVQDLLRDRAIRERRPINDIVTDYVLEVAKAIVAASGESPKAAA